VPAVEQDIVRFWLFKVLRGHQTFDPHDDPAPIAEAVGRVEELLGRHAATGSVLPDSAAVLTVAIQSGPDALQEATLVLPEASRRPAMRRATLVLVDDAPALTRIARDLHAAAPDRLWLLATAAPQPGLDGAVVAQVHRTLQWLRQLMPSLQKVELVGVDRAATSAVLAAQASPTAWSRLSLWADWTLDPWPLTDDQDLMATPPGGLLQLAPRTSLLDATPTARAQAVGQAIGGTVVQRGPDDQLIDWLTSR
jgi:hypothetical protein